MVLVFKGLTISILGLKKLLIWVFNFLVMASFVISLPPKVKGCRFKFGNQSLKNMYSNSTTFFFDKSPKLCKIGSFVHWAGPFLWLVL
jgi:hypothetical protein